MSARGWLVSVAVIMAATAVLEIALAHPEHADLVWHRIPGFDLVYGLLGCAIIVLASKWLGKSFLQRDETYYREPDR